MDPSIIKLFEDDEDEGSHSVAAMDALTAALNRDIEEGSSDIVTQPSEPDAAGVSQDNSSDPMELPGSWHSSAAEKLGQQSQQKEQLDPQPPEEQSSQTEQIDSAKDQHQQVSNQSEHDQQIVQVEQSHSDHQQRQTEIDPFQIAGKDKAPEQNIVPDSKPDMPQHSESQSQPAMQQLNNQQASGANDANTSLRRPRPAPSIPFHMLIPILRPNLDKDRAMQLSSVFNKLRGNEISKEDFLRVIRNIVGDQMLRQAAHKVQLQIQAEAARDAQTNTNPYSLQAQAASHQLSSRGPQLTEPQVFPPPRPTSAQNQKGHKSPPRQPHVPPPAVQMKTGREFPNLEHKQDGKGMHTTQIYSTNMVNPERQNLSVPLSANKQQHGQLSQSFPMYGNAGGNFHTYPRPASSAGATSMETRGASQLTNVMPKYEPQNTTENTRLHGHIPPQKNSLAWQPSANKELNNAFPSMGYVKQEAVDHAVDHSQSSRMGFSTQAETTMQHSHGSSATQPFVAGIPGKTPQKKPLVGQKKPLEAGGTSSPLSSKKQKTSGAFLDQSIEQLNDVTAVSGVNLREEEEQLLSAPKEDSRASEATRRVVQEEEERLILQKGVLQKKLADIMSKSGLEGFGSDVQRCLSLCVEERLRGLISCLIRVSKQRVDTEKTRHKHVCTSDVGRHIQQVNQKAKQEDVQKQAEEAEKLRKLNDSVDTGLEAEKEKDESRSKTVKVNREEDDKMRTTAANVAARAAAGGDDMLSKWQLMAERAKHKRDGVDVGPSSQPSKTTIRKTVPTFSRSLRAQQETEKRGSAGGTRKAGRSQAVAPHARVACSITVKDVISVLEREPQTSKSEIIYRLYDRLASAAD